MRLGRDSDLTVGDRDYRVSTRLKTDEPPLIETSIQHHDKIIFRKTTDVSSLKPLSEHGEELRQKVETQHLWVMDELKAGRLPSETAPPAAHPAIEQGLSRAMSRLAAGEPDRAERHIRELLRLDANLTEARELLEVVRAVGSGRAPSVSTAEDFKTGAEAFAAGKRRQAIELWKRCLAAEPAKRAFQLVVLLATTLSGQRRKAWVQELLALGSKLLADGHSAEAYSLLLVAQSAEQQPPDEAGPPQPLPLAPPSATGPPASTEDTQPHGSVYASPTPPSPTPPSPTPPPPAPTPPTSRAPRAGSEEALFQPPRDHEREAALFDAREAEMGKHRATAEGRGRKGIREHGPARRLPEGLTWWVAGAVGILLAGLALTYLLKGKQALPIEELEEAAGYLNGGQYERAVRSYTQILATHGDVAPAYLGRGRAQLGLGQLDEGVADLTRAVELDPKTPAVAEELGDVLYTRGRFDEAVQSYQRALKAGEVSAESLYRLGSSLVQTERSEEALSHLKAALAKNPSHAEARLLYGRLLNASRRYGEAEEVLKAAKTPVGTGGDYETELAIALLEQGKLEEAEEVARKLLNRQPGDARPPALLGEIYLQRKQYDAARRELIRALRINPTEPRAQIALGRTWLAIGKMREDRSDFTKAKQILVNARGVHEGDRLLTLGQVHLAQGNVETALSLIEQSMSHGASPLAARLALAEARYAAEDLPGTANELQRAAALAPSDPAVALTLGLVYSQLGDARRAAEEYLKAIQGVGMTAPAEQGNGPVVLPRPHIPVPPRFDINRAMRGACRKILSEDAEDLTAVTLKELVESTSFVLSRESSPPEEG